MGVNPYVAFEGNEGSGKSTVSEQVAKRLQSSPHNLEVILVREPGGTEVGEDIRGVLLNKREEPVSPWAEAGLFAAQRAQLMKMKVRPALEAGKLILSDRSAYSSLAYQGGARELGIEDVRTMNHIALEGLWPEIVIFLRIDPEVGFAREDIHDRISSEGIELQKRVADAYEELIRMESEKFIIIDASMSLDDVVAEATEQILKRL